MRHLLLALVGALLAAPVASAQKPTALNLDFKAEIGADGVPTSIEPDESLPPALQALIRKRVAEWRYQMDSWQGQPASGQVHQRIVAEMVPVASGGVALRIQGVIYPTRNMTPIANYSRPVYPSGLLQRGVVATLMYLVRADAEGVPQEVELLYPEKLGNKFKPFDAVARTTIAQWKMPPKKVNGVVISCRQSVPVIFDLPGIEAPRLPSLKSYFARYTDICPSDPTLLSKVAGTML